MSIFRCGKCEGIFDGDYEGCFENPLDDCSSLCEGCSMELEGIKERDMEYEQKLKSLMQSQSEDEDEDYNGPGDEYYENLMHIEHSA